MAVDYDLRSVMFAQAVFRECQKTKKGGRPDMNKVIPRFEAHPLNSSELTLTRTEAAQLFAKVFPKRPSLKALEKATLELTSVYIKQQAGVLGRKRRAVEMQDIKTMDRLHQIAKSARLAGSRSQAGSSGDAPDAEDAGVEPKEESDASEGEGEADGKAEDEAEESVKIKEEGDDTAEEAEAEEAEAEAEEAEAEAGDTEDEAEEDPETFRQRANQILKELQVRKPVSLFSRPVTSEDYQRIVLAPTDLRTIRGSIKDGSISNSKSLQQELLRMFANAVMANAWDSTPSVRARDIEADFEAKHLL